MSDKHTISIELRPRQLEYLRSMAQKYTLTDESKAVRVLIDYAIDETDRETDIYETIRCLDC